MAFTRQWIVDTLRHLGYAQLADQAVEELPEEFDRKQIEAFGNRHGISLDELTSRMGGSP